MRGQYLVRPTGRRRRRTGKVGRDTDNAMSEELAVSTRDGIALEQTSRTYASDDSDVASEETLGLRARERRRDRGEALLSGRHVRTECRGASGGYGAQEIRGCGREKRRDQVLARKPSGSRPTGLPMRRNRQPRPTRPVQPPPPPVSRPLTRGVQRFRPNQPLVLRTAGQLQLHGGQEPQ